MGLNVESHPQESIRISPAVLTGLGSLLGKAYKNCHNLPPFFQSLNYFKFKHSDTCVFLSSLLHYYSKENS